MNLFEKIFNHQILSHLHDSGTFILSTHERAWLKTMLQHPEASHAFDEHTLLKLRTLLDDEFTLQLKDHIIEKARNIEKHVYHPLLRSIRKYIVSKSGMIMTYSVKGGQINRNHYGCPYKLEYSMVKREWYVLWYHPSRQTLMSTKLDNIVSVAAAPIEPEQLAHITKKVSEHIQALKHEAVIEILPLYNAELSRILYALSSFEKHVSYDEELDTYTVSVIVVGTESEYLLSKLRMLGKRVKVISGEYFKQRMLESATKVLDRYGVDATID